MPFLIRMAFLFEPIYVHECSMYITPKNVDYDDRKITESAQRTNHSRVMVSQSLFVDVLLSVAGRIRRLCPLDEKAIGRRNHACQ